MAAVEVFVSSWPQSKLESGLQQLHSADDVVAEWLEDVRLVNALNDNNLLTTKFGTVTHIGPYSRLIVKIRNF